MPDVLVAGQVHPSGMAVLENAPGITIDYIENVDMEPYLDRIVHADAVLLRTQPLTAETLETAERLKIVSRHGVGYDLVDVAALNERNIALAIVGDVNSVAVAELAMTLMLAVGKRLRQMDIATRTGDWEYRNLFESRELNGNTLLIIGFGRIGRRLAGLARAFGMEIIVFDPYVSEVEEGVQLLTDLDEALRRADYVSLHMPSIGNTLIGERELALMKPTSILINTARGGLVDEAALVHALNSGTIAGFGTDVFSTEPPSPDDPLFTAGNVVVTPHAAGISRESAERMAIAAAQNIVDYFDGTLDHSLVVNAKDIRL